MIRRSSFLTEFLLWRAMHPNATAEQISKTGYADGIDLAFANLDVDEGAYREQTIEMDAEDADILAALGHWYVDGQGVYADEEFRVEFGGYGAGQSVRLRIEFSEDHVEWAGFGQERTDE